LKVGFDHFFGYNCQRHAHSYFPKYLYTDDQRFELKGNSDPSPNAPKTYAQNLIADETLRWVRAHAQQPFFLYYSVTLPHAKLEIDDLGAYAHTDWTLEQKTYAAMVTPSLAAQRTPDRRAHPRDDVGRQRLLVPAEIGCWCRIQTGCKRPPRLQAGIV
jgi:hypothetical protein